MAFDGIERQSLGDPLPDRTAPLKRHGANAVDRSYRGNVTPVGTPENILGTLLEASGHVMNAAGQEIARRVEEDKTIQAMNFYQGMAPDDDATVAGYRTHAVLSMSNKVLTSTAALKKEAETFTGTDAEWEQKVRDSQSGDHAALLEEYPELKNDPLAGKSIVAMYGEQVPAIAAVRVGFKLAQEHEGRLSTFRDHIRVRVDGLTQDESDRVLTGVMEDTDTLQLTKKEREKELAALAIEKAEGGDLSIINFTERYKGGQATSLFDRTNALQKAKTAGERVYWMNNQNVIAGVKDDLQGRLNNGELTKDEFYAEADRLNGLYANLAYSDDSMRAAVWASEKPPKDPAMLHAGEDASAKSRLLDELNAGKFKGNRDGFFGKGQAFNDKANRPVVSGEWLMSEWEKHEKGVAETTDITSYVKEFFQAGESTRSPLGQRGLDDETSEAIVDSAKEVMTRAVTERIAALPAKHSPADEQAVRDKGAAAYMRYLSASRLKDPEFTRILSSFKLTDMADAKNMKNLHPNTEKAIALYISMDEGAKALHLPDMGDRAIFENFNTFIEEGVPRVAAMEKAIFAHRHPRNLSQGDLKKLNAEAEAVASSATSRYASKLGYLPGAVYLGIATETAPDWYQELHAERMRKATLANALGGVIEPKAAAQLAYAGFEKTYTKLPNGTHVRGTVPVLAARMNVVPEDVTKYFKIYLEMNKHSLEDAGHVDIKDMYFETNPERGTFQVKTKLGDTLGLPAPLTDLKRGAGAYLDNQREERLKKAKALFSVEGVVGSMYGEEPATLSQHENYVEDRDKLYRTLAFVEGQEAGYDKKAGAFKPVRDINGKQWNIGYGLAISDKEYSRDYIIRGGQRYNLGRLKPSMITPNVAKDLMRLEVSRSEDELRSYWKGYDKLPEKYKGVLINLHYNTGGVKPSNWPRLKEAMDNRDDAGVKREMVTSYTDKKGDKVVLQGRANTVYARLFNK